jgi:hypothetical protein
MILFHVPFRRWPWFHHAWAALVLALLTALVGGIVVKRQESNLFARGAELASLQKQLAEARTDELTRNQADAGPRLPERQIADNVSRDIAAFGQTLGVQISAIQIEQRSATPTDLGAVFFSISGKSDYRSTKTWVSDLLGRYPSLAIKTLSLQALPNEAARLDIRITLVLYVKD